MTHGSAHLRLDVDPSMLPILTQSSHLYNDDLAPVPTERRKWRVGSFAALWISMSACIPTYMLASSLIGGGMNWWQAILTIFLGNLIVLIPMILNAHAGTQYGIPFPGFLPRVVRHARREHSRRCCARSSPAAGSAFRPGSAAMRSTKSSASSVPSLARRAPRRVLGITLRAVRLLPLFLGHQHAGHLQGHRFHPLAARTSKRRCSSRSACCCSGGPIETPAASARFSRSRPRSIPGSRRPANSWPFFVPALTGMIGFWATLSLNIPDFSRYARSQRDQVVGQALGLPLTMALYSFIGVAVTSATTIIYGETIWDPVDVLTRFKNPVVLVVAMLALCIATLATNIAANVVSPANDFAHLAPRKISFRIGGFITGIIGVLMMPWKLVADPTGYIFTWLVGYSALLGPIGGILIADYFVCRRKQLDVAALYRDRRRVSLSPTASASSRSSRWSSRCCRICPDFSSR